ncbi:MAG: deoxyhypusine synthase family protein [Pseudomonadota bacterium]|nr:MAG: deoxyhypusine synthase [Pseudomonadota bacterium]
MTTTREILKHHFRHFNARTLVDAAQAWVEHADRGGKMVLAMAGAMSTAELGVSLAKMIREEKVHAISCTGANLEEDIFNLVAHEEYVRIENWRNLSPADEAALRDRGLSRVTDTCIPEEAAMRRVENKLLALWKEAAARGEQKLPHEYVYELVRSGSLEESYQIDPARSWVVAAAEKNLPLFVPGWEDSTLGNFFASQVHQGEVPSSVVASGIAYMQRLIDWYRETSRSHPVGFFQIGGGIAGDFALCVVPLLKLDLGLKDTPFWAYYCQISDSTTSYGSYSGCTPNEKITWSKLDVNTPGFIIESDATIVAPLVFCYVLDSWLV